jgi:ribonuclease R
MEAERDTIDRYVAAYLSTMVGEVVKTRITGVAKFGFFATVDGLGGDGLVPVSTLGAERFVFDEDARVLEGVATGTRYEVGQRLELRLAEANPITGALRYELVDGGSPPAQRRDRTRPGGGPRGFQPRPGKSRVPPGVRRGKR